jgi:hypothetical protein
VEIGGRGRKNAHFSELDPTALALNVASKHLLKMGLKALISLEV